MCDEDERVRGLASIAYVVLGVLVASQHDYYAHLTTVSQVVSAVADGAVAADPVRSEPSSQPRPAVGERCDASTAARQALNTSTEAAETPNFGG